MSIKTTLIQASPEYLSELIVSGIREELQKIQLNSNKTDRAELLTRKQVCTLLGCSTVSLWNWANKKKLVPVKLGKIVRYKKSDVELFIEQCHG
ncbi:helix-turn-helix domain-containing protein [Elizabethkingia ursingii]|uniref:helix-turn-helix domain-containing protein n=1 Tax=Elizabethkingia ursingii TaxID=1756150 RepID=UPI0020111CE2|nr:helix-turn-helix domain-containing protein [Elizabethkingia ursingii]MCL1666614.1 helix-turn-helix domain-containing protein [Elizabethkingia ursingii]